MSSTAVNKKKSIEMSVPQARGISGASNTNNARADNNVTPRMTAGSRADIIKSQGKSQSKFHSFNFIFRFRVKTELKSFDKGPVTIINEKQLRSRHERRQNGPTVRIYKD